MALNGFDNSDLKLIIFGGKGGVGKTVVPLRQQLSYPKISKHCSFQPIRPIRCRIALNRPLDFQFRKLPDMRTWMRLKWMPKSHFQYLRPIITAN